MISLSVYLDISSSMARDRRDAARRLVADGLNALKVPTGFESFALTRTLPLLAALVRIEPDGDRRQPSLA